MSTENVYRSLIHPNLPSKRLSPPRQVYFPSLIRLRHEELMGKKQPKSLSISNSSRRFEMLDSIEKISRSLSKNKHLFPGSMLIRKLSKSPHRKQRPRCGNKCQSELMRESSQQIEVKIFNREYPLGCISEKMEEKVGQKSLGEMGRKNSRVVGGDQYSAYLLNNPRDKPIRDKNFESIAQKLTALNKRLAPKIGDQYKYGSASALERLDTSMDSLGSNSQSMFPKLKAKKVALYISSQVKSRYNSHSPDGERDGGGCGGGGGGRVSYINNMSNINNISNINNTKNINNIMRNNMSMNEIEYSAGEPEGGICNISSEYPKLHEQSYYSIKNKGSYGCGRGTSLWKAKQNLGDFQVNLMTPLEKRYFDLKLLNTEVPTMCSRRHLLSNYIYIYIYIRRLH